MLISLLKEWALLFHQFILNLLIIAEWNKRNLAYSYHSATMWGIQFSIVKSCISRSFRFIIN